MKKLKYKILKKSIVKMLKKSKQKVIPKNKIIIANLRKELKEGILYEEL